MLKGFELPILRGLQGFFRKMFAAARDFVRNRTARLSADGPKGFGAGELHGGVRLPGSRFD